MHSNHSRGVALVNAIWCVLFALTTILGFGMWAMKNSDNEALMKTASDAKRAQTAAEEAKKATEKDMGELSAAVGYNDATKAGSRSSLIAVKQAIESLRSSVPEVSSEVKSLELALRRMSELNGQKNGELAEKESQRKRMDGEAAEARSTTDKVSREKQTQIDDLRKQMTDAQGRADAEKGALEARLVNVQNENRNIDQKGRDAQAEADKKESAYRRQVTILNSRINEMQKKLAFTKEPARPDGSILSVNEKLDLVYLDLGTRNKLRRGMRFDVLTADVNAPNRHKGAIEVTEVHPEYSEARVIETVDKFVPLATGDLLTNPLYDPKSERKAVLVGRFSGRYSRQQITALLNEIGIQVQSNVDVTSDYLILGNEEIENGEPVPFAQNAEFKRAEQLGVGIMPLKQIESFFVF